MTARDKRAAKDGAAPTPQPAAPSEAPIPTVQPQPAEGPATTPEQPATHPEQPATLPSDGERSPEDRAKDRLELSKATDGTEPDPSTAVYLGSSAPITRYVLGKAEPVRAGGHVLTERGWVPDTTPEQEH